MEMDLPSYRLLQLGAPDRNRVQHNVAFTGDQPGATVSLGFL